MQNILISLPKCTGKRIHQNRKIKLDCSKINKLGDKMKEDAQSFYFYEPSKTKSNGSNVSLSIPEAEGQVSDTWSGPNRTHNSILYSQWLLRNRMLPSCLTYSYYLNMCNTSCILNSMDQSQNKSESCIDTVNSSPLNEVWMV